MSCESLCDHIGGECFGESCVCRNLYFGDFCQQSFADDGNENVFWGLFYFYQVIALVIYVTLFGLSVFIAYAVLKTSGIKNVAGLCLASVFGALTLRILSVLIDPNNTRAIFPIWLDNLFFTMTLMFLIIGCLFIEFFWMELIIKTGLKSTLSLKRLIPWSIGIGIGWFVVFFGVALWASLTVTEIGGIVLMIVVGVAIFFLLAVTVYLGVKTRQSIRTKWVGSNSGEAKFQKANFLLKRVIGYSIGLSFLLFAALVTVILQSFINPQNYGYFIFQIIEQFEFGGMLLCILLFFWRRSSSKSKSSSKRASLSATTLSDKSRMIAYDQAKGDAEPNAGTTAKTTESSRNMEREEQAQQQQQSQTQRDTPQAVLTISESNDSNTIPNVNQEVEISEDNNKTIQV